MATSTKLDDRAVLQMCLQAFKAIPEAKTARKMLIMKLGKLPKAYEGDGRKLLAAQMAALLELHLDISSTSSSSRDEP